MSYLVCPDCGKKINVFGESHLEEVAEKEGVKILARIPIDPKVAEMVDGGRIEYVDAPWLDDAVEASENI